MSMGQQMIVLLTATMAAIGAAVVGRIYERQ